MKAYVLSVLVAVLVADAIHAQKPVTPPPQTPIPERTTREKSRDVSVLVRGCIRGKHLQVSDLHTRDSVFEALRVTEFILQGPKELLRQIKDQHEGHTDQIEGTAIVPPAITGASTAVTTKEFGKTRVTLAGREEGKAYVEEPRKPLTLKVTSLTHLSEGCAGH
jgi:hypothetical protein